MRILANYGCKTNGESYSVTLETMGDVNKQNIEENIDELFVLAKAAIKRQIESNLSEEEKEGAGEENGKEHQANNQQTQNSDSPASKKQKDLIIKLAKQKGRFIENLNSLTIAEASETIEELIAA